METDPTRVAEILVGLGADVTIIGVDDDVGEPLRVHVRLVRERPLCQGCGGPVKIGDTARVELVDLAAFGRATRLVWHKRLWRCQQRCGHGAVTEQADEIAAPRHRLTTRAGRWATVQVGGYGRPVQHVADELGADWHTINDAVTVWGQALLDADEARVGSVTAVGLDETLFAKTGRYRCKQWATSIVDVGSGQLLDMVQGRDAVSVTEWFAAQPDQWRDQIRYAALDMSSGYKLVYDTILPNAIQVIDPFHLIKLATSKIDDCRRRVQNEQLGHRGRKPDPLYRSRRLLTMGAERLDAERHHRLRDLLNEGDPDGEIRRVWWAKEKLRDLYKRPERAAAAATLRLYADAFRQPRNPPELRQLGRTITKWLTPITAWWLHAQISNGPTEGANNLIKRTKRIGFGFTNFNNYRTRCLLYAGKPNWHLLDTLNPPEIR